MVDKMVDNATASQAEFARIAGVSRQTISKLLHTRLADARVGKRVDTSHPVVLEYLSLKTPGVPVPPMLKRKKKKAKTPSNKGPLSNQARGPMIKEAQRRIESGEITAIDALSDDVTVLLDYKLRDIVEHFGIGDGLKNFLTGVKTIAEIEKVKLANEEKRGGLVNLDTVERGIMDPINAAWTKMLRDGAQTIAKSVVLKVQAGEGEQEIGDFIRDSLGGFIRMAKSKCKRTITECKSRSTA